MLVATLMDKARQRRGIPTDMALGERLGRSRQVVSQWRSGDKFPDEEVIVQLADLAGDDPGEWLLAIKAVRSEGAAGRAWAALAKRLGASAALLIVMVLGSAQQPAQAASKDYSADSPIYIMRS
ncbi:helix-turn-helix domain-containing protein [Pseudoxanthomonas winnipegensis]|uniref:helix-turn-helix domain-containing protein n=1 Tax=Pseudoxanthomonas winnipegensis TaxID=2480810 RepID=UPI0025781553|nr:helix-turn-helix transcriptional regulator [Pseudoxanthomonas winnipegensis]WJI17481.1 helix-turn-helix domain-containing protein [Pseudoxanthomonas winnipegensis]